MSARLVELGLSSAAGAAPAGWRSAAQPMAAYMCEGNLMPDEGFTELAGPRVTLRRFHPGDVTVAVPAVTPVAGHGAEGDRQGTPARTVRMPSGSSNRIPVSGARELTTASCR